MSYVIYKLTNKLNGHSYVGFTTDLERRLQEHRFPSQVIKYPNSILYRAISKYGRDNFSFEILESGEDDSYGLSISEPKFIALLKPHYNMTSGGEGVCGVSIETKQRMSESHKGLRESSETKKKKSDALRGKPKTPLHVENMIKAKKGKLCGEENPFYGRTHTEETRKRISEAKRNKKHE